MSKKKSKDVAKKTEAKGEKPDEHNERQDGFRETFESVVVAFVLAFLFRAFEAEAFVIPTGSMAPTLYGRHKEADCKQCGHHFVFGASDEIENEYYAPMKRIETAFCPNCRFENVVRDAPVFKGDRILVNKFPYELGDPQRWDVPVFKYPEEPTTNYIKRLVGLPNEVLVISQGNIFQEIKDDEKTRRKILRKPPSKQMVLQMLVYNNNHQEKMLHDMGWPKRWAPVERVSPDVGEAQKNLLDLGPIAGWTEANNSWQESAENHSFSIAKAKAPTLKWLRYRHFVPSPGTWDDAAEEFQARGPDAAFDHQQRLGPHAQLVSDFCGYNTYTGGSGNTRDDAFWVSDLTLSCSVDITEIQLGAEVVFELNEGNLQYRVRVDLNTGKAKLVKVTKIGTDYEEDVLGEADCDLSGIDDFHVRFANVDDRLCFWLDDDLVDFGSKAELELDASMRPGPSDGDLIPVGIAVQQASVSVSDLLIERDIYYRASKTDPQVFNDEEHPDQYDLRRVLDNPSKWGEKYYGRRREARFELKAAEYLMLGDNSPRSQDSRVWPNQERNAERRHAVPRSALVGRAFYIYWPHGIPFMNDGNGYTATVHKKRQEGGVVKSDYPDMRFPFYPNFGRMRRIR